MSRVDSVKLAVMKAQVRCKAAWSPPMPSFPFPDGRRGAAKAGATAVIQPGGSMRDNDVIAAADRLDSQWSSLEYATSFTRRGRVP